MKKLLFPASLLIISLFSHVSFPEVAQAQLSTGGFSGGTSDFPAGGADGGTFEIPAGGADGSGASTGGFSGGTFEIPLGGGNFGNLLPEPIAGLFINIASLVGNIETFLSEAGVEVELGGLGLPDIVQATDIFENDNQIDIAGDVFGSQTGSTVILDDSLKKQFLKDLGNEYAQNSALSQEGQEIILEQIRISQENAELSNQYAEDSSAQDVSQNILRNISGQLALQQRHQNMEFFTNREEKIARSLELSMQGESVVALDKLTTTRDREAMSILKAGMYHQGLMSVPSQHLVPN